MIPNLKPKTVNQEIISILESTNPIVVRYNYNISMLYIQIRKPRHNNKSRSRTKPLLTSVGFGHIVFPHNPTFFARKSGYRNNKKVSFCVCKFSGFFHLLFCLYMSFYVVKVKSIIKTYINSVSNPRKHIDFLCNTIVLRFCIKFREISLIQRICLMVFTDHRRQCQAKNNMLYFCL